MSSDVLRTQITALENQLHRLQGELRQSGLHAERQERLQARQSCLQFLCDETIRDQEKDKYIPLAWVKNWLATFYVADRNVDGKLHPEELLALYKDDPKTKQDVANFFRQQDINKDSKLSLSEFFILGHLRNEYIAGFPHCKEFKSA